MATLEQYVEAVRDRVRETGFLISHDMGDSAYQRFIRTALRRYSIDRPKIKVNQIVGAASKYITVNSTNLPSFIDGFSIILNIEIESPVIASDESPNYIERDSWDFYRDSTLLYIFLHDHETSVSENVRLTYTIFHTINGLDSETVDTIPAQDFEAIIYWAVAEALLALSNKFADTIDPTIRADNVNYRSKSVEYRNQAKEFRLMYKEWIAMPYTPESITRDLDFGYTNYTPWQTHQYSRL